MSTKILGIFMGDYGEIAKRIENACGGLSHAKAAEYLGIKSSTYGAIVAPKDKEPTSINLKTLKALFEKGISSDWILFESLPKYVHEKGTPENISDLKKVVAIIGTLSAEDRQRVLAILLGL